MPLIEKRYAEALLKLSNNDDWIEKSLESLKVVTNAYNTTIDLKSFLTSPEIKNSDKKETMSKILSNNFDIKFINFILLLIDKGRIKFLPSILNEYIILSNKVKNILDIEIISSEKLSTDQIMKIENKYKKLHNTNKIKSTTKVDVSLIGGIKIIIGDKIYDNSIKAQLLNLKTSLNLV